MSAFQGEPAPTRNLDLLAEMNEPMELMIAIERIAIFSIGRLTRTHQPTESWQTVAEHAKACVHELKVLNR
jgi:hypothetical protein